MAIKEIKDIEGKNIPMEIVIDDGSRRVPITNIDGEEIGVFRFRPTDIGIIERYNAMMDKLDDVTAPLAALPDAADGDSDNLDEQQVEALKEATKRLYAAVDELLGGDAAGAFFGKMNPFSPVDGKFYCEVVLASVGEFISAQFDAETKKMNARVAKYTNRVNRARKAGK